MDSKNPSLFRLDMERLDSILTLQQQIDTAQKIIDDCNTSISSRVIGYCVLAPEGYAIEVTNYRSEGVLEAQYKIDLRKGRDFIEATWDNPRYMKNVTTSSIGDRHRFIGNVIMQEPSEHKLWVANTRQDFRVALGPRMNVRTVPIDEN